MRVSAKSDYALRVLFHLTEVYQGEQTRPVSIRTLAERNDIPRRFLEHIMIDLRSRGWVRSIAGREGGFVLGMDPDQITMGQVIRHFEGYIAPIECVSATNYQACSQQPRCKFRRVFLEIRNLTAAVMDRATLALVASGKPVVHCVVADETYADGAGI